METSYIDWHGGSNVTHLSISHEYTLHEEISRFLVMTSTLVKEHLTYLPRDILGTHYQRR